MAWTKTNVDWSGKCATPMSLRGTTFTLQCHKPLISWNPNSGLRNYLKSRRRYRQNNMRHHDFYLRLWCRVNTVNVRVHLIMWWSWNQCCCAQFDSFSIRVLYHIDEIVIKLTTHGIILDTYVNIYSRDILNFEAQNQYATM